MCRCGVAIPAPSTFTQSTSAPAARAFQHRAQVCGGNLAAPPRGRRGGVFFGRLRLVLHTNFFWNLRAFYSVDLAHVVGGLPRYRPGLCPVVGPAFWCPARLTRARPFLFNDVWRPRLLWRPSGRKVRKEKGRKHRGQVRERRYASRRSRFGNRCGYFAPQPPTKTKFCGWPVKHSNARFGVPFACYQAPRIEYKTGYQPVRRSLSGRSSLSCRALSLCRRRPSCPLSLWGSILARQSPFHSVFRAIISRVTSPRGAVTSRGIAINYIKNTLLANFEARFHAFCIAFWEFLFYFWI